MSSLATLILLRVAIFNACVVWPGSYYWTTDLYGLNIPGVTATLCVACVDPGWVMVMWRPGELDFVSRSHATRLAGR